MMVAKGLTIEESNVRASLPHFGSDSLAHICILQQAIVKIAAVGTMSLRRKTGSSGRADMTGIDVKDAELGEEPSDRAMVVAGQRKGAGARKGDQGTELVSSTFVCRGTTATDTLLSSSSALLLLQTTRPHNVNPTRAVYATRLQPYVLVL